MRDGNDELITVVHKPCLASNLGDCDHVMLTHSRLWDIIPMSANPTH